MGGLMWRSRARSHTASPTALAQDRRRIAADVHDLIMQDLSFALATTRMLAEDPAAREHARVAVEAGERALAGARHVVRGLLSHEDGEPIVQVVETSVRAAARRAPLKFQAVGAHAMAKPDGPTVHTLIHVAREAVTNAVKHSGPRTPVEVLFERGEEWRLTIRDRGCGFDPVGAPAGFGLPSMQARARELGGSLRVLSSPGEGSTVELTLP
jgi:signal transduction histidine kinase